MNTATITFIVEVFDDDEMTHQERLDEVVNDMKASCIESCTKVHHISARYVSQDLADAKVYKG